jgi:hypothetical protein
VMSDESEGVYNHSLFLIINKLLLDLLLYKCHHDEQLLDYFLLQALEYDLLDLNIYQDFSPSPEVNKRFFDADS